MNKRRVSCRELIARCPRKVTGACRTSAGGDVPNPKRTMKSNSPLHEAALRPVQCESNKRNAKSRITAITSLAGAALLALTGCASTNQTGSKGKQALVCPQCKMVQTEVYLPAGPSFSRAGVSAYGLAGERYPRTVSEHQCPGCQGAITTLFKEGKLKHKCSVCKESPFTCPVFHPTNS